MLHHSQNTFPGLQKHAEMKAEREAVRASVGEGGRSSLLQGRLASGVKKSLLEDSVGLGFFLGETHPVSVCSWFASWPAKPPQRRESGQWERIKTLMLSTTWVKKWVVWFICCVGISNEHWISSHALSSCSGLNQW